MQRQIGELADSVGVNTKTIRYYESIKLLPEPSRTPSGYRIYGPDDETRLTFVRPRSTWGSAWMRSVRSWPSARPAPPHANTSVESSASRSGTSAAASPTCAGSARNCKASTRRSRTIRGMQQRCAGSSNTSASTTRTRLLPLRDQAGAARSAAR